MAAAGSVFSNLWAITNWAFTKTWICRHEKWDIISLFYCMFCLCQLGGRLHYDMLPYICPKCWVHWYQVDSLKLVTVVVFTVLESCTNQSFLLYHSFTAVVTEILPVHHINTIYLKLKIISTMYQDSKIHLFDSSYLSWPLLIILSFPERQYRST